MGGYAIELYPGDAGANSDYKSGGAVLLGFKVQSLDRVIDEWEKLDLDQELIAEYTNRGSYTDVLDPDGRLIRVKEQTRE
jgi:hypothetical protein